MARPEDKPVRQMFVFALAWFCAGLYWLHFRCTYRWFANGVVHVSDCGFVCLFGGILRTGCVAVAAVFYWAKVVGLFDCHARLVVGCRVGARLCVWRISVVGDGLRAGGQFRVQRLVRRGWGTVVLV